MFQMLHLSCFFLLNGKTYWKMVKGLSNEPAPEFPTPASVYSVISAR